jgi:hypothetical protein
MSLARPDLMDALRRSVEGEKPGRGSGAEQSDRPQETGQGAETAAGEGSAEGGLRETSRCQPESARTPAAILSRLLAFQVLMCGSSCSTTFNNELWTSRWPL